MLVMPPALDQGAKWPGKGGRHALYRLGEESLRRAVQRRARMAVHPDPKPARGFLLLPADQHVSAPLLNDRVFPSFVMLSCRLTPADDRIGLAGVAVGCSRGSEARGRLLTCARARATRLPSSRKFLLKSFLCVPFLSFPQFHRPHPQLPCRVKHAGDGCGRGYRWIG